MKRTSNRIVDTIGLLDMVFWGIFNENINYWAAPCKHGLQIWTPGQLLISRLPSLCIWSTPSKSRRGNLLALKI